MSDKKPTLKVRNIRIVCQPNNLSMRSKREIGSISGVPLSNQGEGLTRSGSQNVLKRVNSRIFEPESKKK